MHTHIHIYIERERERERKGYRERERERDRSLPHSLPLNFIRATVRKSIYIYTSVGTFHINGMCFVDPREKFIQREEWILSACCDR